MSTTIEPVAEKATPEAESIGGGPPLPVGEQAVTLLGIGWEGFETIAKLKGERRVPRLIYYEGSLTLVSPSGHHEGTVDRLDAIVKVICEELDIVYRATGATLFRRKDMVRGIEGDKTFYLANQPVVRGKREIDLDIDPPPDLAIEVEITHPAKDAVETWRNLGTPEVWIYRVRRRRTALTILHRDARGQYMEAATSRSLPFLAAEEILDWIGQPIDEPDNRWMRRLRAWARGELIPRVAQGPGGPPR